MNKIIYSGSWDTCACQAKKRVEHSVCYKCFSEAAAKDGRICSCGKPKQAEFDLCYTCNKGWHRKTSGGDRNTDFMDVL